MVGVSRPKAAT